MYVDVGMKNKLSIIRDLKIENFMNYMIKQWIEKNKTVKKIIYNSIFVCYILLSLFSKINF